MSPLVIVMELTAALHRIASKGAGPETYDVSKVQPVNPKGEGGDGRRRRDTAAASPRGQDHQGWDSAEHHGAGL